MTIQCTDNVHIADEQMPPHCKYCGKPMTSFNVNDRAKVTLDVTTEQTSIWLSLIGEVSKQRPLTAQEWDAYSNLQVFHMFLEKVKQLS